MYSCHSFLYNKLCAIKEVHMTFEWHNKDLNPITSRYFKHTFCAAVLDTLEAWDKWSSSPALHWMSLIILGWEGIRTAKASLDQAFYSQVLWRSDQDLEPVWWSPHTQSWPGVGLFAQMNLEYLFCECQETRHRIEETKVIYTYRAPNFCDSITQPSSYYRKNK